MPNRCTIDLLGSGLLDSDNKVDNGDVGGGDSESHTCGEQNKTNSANRLTLVLVRTLIKERK